MLRRLLEYQYRMTEKGKRLHPFRTAVAAMDTFLFEARVNTHTAPHIRDAVDLKRWMILVVVALLPCIVVAIWNTGLQAFVYGSGNYQLMDEYLDSLYSFDSYFAFAFKDGRWAEILKWGCAAFFPLVLISYLVGGVVELAFAILRGHDVAEGFLVTGILYPLVLPPTIPYWMAAVGIAVGIFFGKEVFGGTGMNIMNPALACRAFLFFTFPGKMTGDVWVGTNPTVVRESLMKMNQEAHRGALDGYAQASRLMRLNVSHEIKAIHADAIASNTLGSQVASYPEIEQAFAKYRSLHEGAGQLGHLPLDTLRDFVTSPSPEGGLGLSVGHFDAAYHFAALDYGIGPLNSDWSFFFGNKLGCLGETSVLACLIGALILIWTGVGSWRTMVAVALGAFLTATCFNAFTDSWAPASFSFPAYKHLLLGGLAFGLVFMATDPVSSPAMKSAQWVYGLFIGLVTVVIRLINPAYPEGMMLAIILGNVFAPLFDHYAARIYRRKLRAARA